MDIFYKCFIFSSKNRGMRMETGNWIRSEAIWMRFTHGQIIRINSWSRFGYGMLCCQKKWSRGISRRDCMGKRRDSLLISGLHFRSFFSVMHSATDLRMTGWIPQLFCGISQVIFLPLVCRIWLTQTPLTFSFATFLSVKFAFRPCFDLFLQ